MANELDSLDYVVIQCVECGVFDEAWEPHDNYVCPHCTKWKDEKTTPACRIDAKRVVVNCHIHGKVSYQGVPDLGGDMVTMYCPRCQDEAKKSSTNPKGR